jgi:hypothetical protein
MTMNPWLFWMIWVVLANVAILMMMRRVDDKPVTDAEWIEWQKYCKEQRNKRTSRS